MSRAQLAHELGVDAGTLRLIETGRCRPPQDVARRLCEALTGSLSEHGR